MANKLTWKGKEVIGAVRQKAMQGILDAGEFALGESNQRAPIDEGTLIGSGTVTPDEAHLTAVISYDTPYALRQHEDTTLRHSNGRQAKFLEHAISENADVIQQYIATAIEDALK